jgi:formate hydrogenlyase subunit 3/multisubunit Na+/H+ antiporter MnhD subunit
MNLMFGPILVPAIAALIVLFVRNKGAQAALAVLASLVNLVLAALLFGGVRGAKDGVLTATMPWAGDVVLGLGSGEHPLFALGNLGAFILLAAAGFAFLVALYSWKFLEKHPQSGVFYVLMLLTAALTGGAVMADHLIVLLFFWEGMAGTIFGMIAIGQGNGKFAWKTATKALLIGGVCDLCMILGIVMVGYLGKTLYMSELARTPMQVEGWAASVAFIMLMIGAIAKGGSMPFHTWIPDAATDAPTPFMAFLPASLEKLLGIYLLTRITLDIFHLKGEGPLCMLMMVVGALTILLAVAMALVQKDYKRLLSYHAISQVGYMVLGVGTGSAMGIVGGLFHMVNNGLYKSCLFMTAGNVEKQAGTTDLRKLGGLAGKMPITWVCFAIAALSISGFPLTNGFYSKELVYEAALHHGWYFYAAAALGTVLTAASFLKLGHAVYLGKREAALEKVQEAPASMYLPTVALAVLCLVFGLYNYLPIGQLIVPGVEGSLNIEEHLWGLLPASWLLAGGTVVALLIALVNHLYGVKKTGSGVGAVDHIHHAPVLATIYDRAGRGWFDPYVWGMALANVVGQVGNGVNLVLDFMYDSLIVGLTMLLSWFVRKANTGSYAMYVVWSLAGAAVLIWYLLR